MHIVLDHQGPSTVAVQTDTELLISSAQDALDLTASVFYEYQTTKLVLQKENFGDDFYRLSTGLLGDVLQKFTNYHFQVAIVGDFSHYEKTSKPMRDFIYESNKGKQIFFLPDIEGAIEKLHRVSV